MGSTQPAVQEQPAAAVDASKDTEQSPTTDQTQPVDTSTNADQALAEDQDPEGDLREGEDATICPDLVYQPISSSIAAQFEKYTGENVSDVIIAENPALEEQGKRGVAIDGRCVEVVPGCLKDVPLCAHELAHIVQQRNADSEGNVDVEAEADKVAHSICTGTSGVRLSIAGSSNQKRLYKELNDEPKTEADNDKKEPKKPEFLSDLEFSEISDLQAKGDYNAIMKILAQKAKLPDEVVIQLVSKKDINGGEAATTLGEKTVHWLNERYKFIQSENPTLKSDEVVFLLIGQIKEKKLESQYLFYDDSLSLPYTRIKSVDIPKSARIHFLEEYLRDMSHIALGFNILLHEKVHVNQILFRPSLAIPLQVDLADRLWLDGTYSGNMINGILDYETFEFFKAERIKSEIHAYIMQMHDPSIPFSDLSPSDIVAPIENLEKYWGDLGSSKFQDEMRGFLRPGFKIYVENYYQQVKVKFEELEKQTKLACSISDKDEDIINFTTRLLDEVRLPFGKISEMQKKKIINQAKTDENFMNMLKNKASNGELMEAFILSNYLKEINEIAQLDDNLLDSIKKMDKETSKSMEKYPNRNFCKERWTRWKKISDAIIYGENGDSDPAILAAKSSRGVNKNNVPSQTFKSVFGPEPFEIMLEEGDPIKTQEFRDDLGSYMDTNYARTLDGTIIKIQNLCQKDICSQGEIEIVVYATKTGSDAYNKELNQKRISSIRNYFDKNLKISNVKISFVNGGYWDKEKPGVTIHFVEKGTADD